MNIIDRGPSRAADGAVGAATPLAPFPNFTAQGLDRLRQMYAALPSSRDALGALFAVQAAQTAPNERWTTFFIETASAQLVWDERPTGTLTDGDAAWVLERFDEAPSIEVLGLLARLLEEAQRVPNGFPAAVRQRAAFFKPRTTVLEDAPRKPARHLRLVVSEPAPVNG